MNKTLFYDKKYVALIKQGLFPAINRKAKKNRFIEYVLISVSLKPVRENILGSNHAKIWFKASFCGLKKSSATICGPRNKILSFMVRIVKKFGNHCFRYSGDNEALKQPRR
jgi:hypothetical protein